MFMFNNILTVRKEVIVGRLSRFHKLVLESDTASERLYMCCLSLNKLVDDFNHCFFDDVCKVINTLRLVFLELLNITVR